MQKFQTQKLTKSKEIKNSKITMKLSCLISKTTPFGNLSPDEYLELESDIEVNNIDFQISLI